MSFLSISEGHSISWRPHISINWSTTSGGQSRVVSPGSSISSTFLRADLEVLVFIAWCHALRCGERSILRRRIILAFRRAVSSSGGFGTISSESGIMWVIVNLVCAVDCKWGCSSYKLITEKSSGNVKGKKELGGWWVYLPGCLLSHCRQ